MKKIQGNSYLYLLWFLKNSFIYFNDLPNDLKKIIYQETIKGSIVINGNILYYDKRIKLLRNLYNDIVIYLTPARNNDYKHIKKLSQLGCKKMISLLKYDVVISDERYNYFIDQSQAYKSLTYNDRYIYSNVRVKINYFPTGCIFRCGYGYTENEFDVQIFYKIKYNQDTSMLYRKYKTIFKGWMQF